MCIRDRAKNSGRSVEEERKDIEAANPQNRLVQSSEIAEMVSFLCSDLSPALTMEDIQINAGAFWWVPCLARSINNPVFSSTVDSNMYVIKSLEIIRANVFW